MKRLIIFGSVNFPFLTSVIILMSVRLNLVPLKKKTKTCFLLKYNHTDSDIMMIIHSMFALLSYLSQLTAVDQLSHHHSHDCNSSTFIKTMCSSSPHDSMHCVDVLLRKTILFQFTETVFILHIIVLLNRITFNLNILKIKCRQPLLDTFLDPNRRISYLSVNQILDSW